MVWNGVSGGASAGGSCSASECFTFCLALDISQCPLGWHVYFLLCVCVEVKEEAERLEKKVES